MYVRSSNLQENPTVNTLKEWMQLATTAEQTRLATLAFTSRSYLYELASGNRIASAQVAGDIEKASKILRKSSKQRLPLLKRMDLCPACAACIYAPKCKK